MTLLTKDDELDRILTELQEKSHGFIYSHQPIPTSIRESAKQRIQELYVSKREIPKGTAHCEDLSVAWCNDCLKEWHDTVCQKLNQGN